jgi:serine/threonine-protein kinase
MLKVSTRLGPYEIVALLGSGGMGEVYRARDVRLDREVAIKVLPDLYAENLDRRSRFEREAKAIAALSHPNILAIHDYGSAGNVTYAVMELLEGETLRGRLAKDRVPWKESIEIGAAIAEGLAAAHAKGIIHRDIKPENLFLTKDGRVKILDFGLARMEISVSTSLETGPHSLAQTDSGVVVGTVGYMSPEQLRGQPAEARSDLFALGCVLFELVTGKHPFRGRTPAETAGAILHDEAPALANFAAELPQEFDGLIRQCLAKEVDKRVASAHNLAFALRAILSGTDLSRSQTPTTLYRTKPPRPRYESTPSLAVLPLANTNFDAELDYLSDGIAEGIINLLSRIPGLRVMARNTAFRYKGKDVDAQEVGRALKVRAVLTGQLFKRDDRLVIKMELVDVKNGALLWSEHYNQKMSNILAVEETITQVTADKLRLRLTGEEKRRLSQPRTHNAEAYRCYLMGRYHWNKRSAEGLKKSVKLFEQAIEIDPTYALAYTGLADAYLNLGGWGHQSFHEAYPRAKAAANRALEFDENLAEAHVSLAMALKEYDWDWPRACREYERALELNPNNAIAHQWFGEYLAAVGRHQESIAEIKRAIDLDPLSLIIHATLGRHGYYFARQYDQAIAQLRKTLDIDGSFWVARLWLGWTYANLDRIPEAFAELQIARQLDDNLEIVMALGYTLGRSGRHIEAQQVLAELEQLSSTRYVSPMLGALIATGMGEHDQAFGWLEKAYADRAQMLSELQAEPAFDPLRADPRFGGLLRQIGLSACPLPTQPRRPSI